MSVPLSVNQVNQEKMRIKKLPKEEQTTAYLRMQHDVLQHIRRGHPYPHALAGASIIDYLLPNPDPNSFIPLPPQDR